MANSWGRLSLSSAPETACEKPLIEVLDENIQFEILQAFEPPSKGAAESFRLPPESQGWPQPGETFMVDWEEPDPAQGPESLLPSQPLAAAQVLQATPQGSVDQVTEIRLVFDPPPVALGQDLPGPTYLEPALEGQWLWRSPRMLCFTFSSSPPLGRTITYGWGEQRWSFIVSPPRLQSLGASSQDLQPTIQVGISQSVDRSRSRLQLWLNDQPLEPNWTGERSAQASLPDQLEIETEYRLRAQLRAFALSGDEFHDSQLESKFHTYFRFALECRVEGTTVERQSGRRLVEMTVHSKNGLLPDQELPTITCTPPLEEMQLSLEADARTALIRVRGYSNSPALRLQVEAGLLDAYQQSSPEPVIFELELGNLQKGLFGPAGMILLIPGKQANEITFFSLNQTKVQALGREQNRDTVNSWNEGQGCGPILQLPLPFENQPNTMVDQRVALDTFLPRGGGLTSLQICTEESQGSRLQDLAFLEIPDGLYGMLGFRQSLMMLVLRTQLGLSCLHDGRQALVYSWHLSQGQPLSGADLEGTITDPHGLAVLPFRPSIWAEHGEWVAFLPLRSPGVSPTVRDEIFWVTDRGLYRPGERIQFTGWLRRWQDSQLTLGSQPSLMEGHLRDATGKSHQLQVQLSPSGLLQADFELPLQADLGQWHLYLHNSATSFRVEEFRRPEFSVQADWQKAGLSIKASYYSGGGLAQAPFQYQLKAQQLSFRPAGRERFSFGEGRPIWRCWLYDETPLTHHLEISGKLDDQGQSFVELEQSQAHNGLSWLLTATVSVSDLNQQVQIGQATRWAHPAQVYVGLRARRQILDESGLAELEVLVCDWEGKAVPGRKVTLCFQDWAGGEALEFQLLSQETPLHQQVKVDWPITRCWAEVWDEQGCSSRSQLPLWRQQGFRAAGQAGLEVIPSQTRVAPGQTTELLVVSPHYPAYGFLAVCREGILRHHPLELLGPATSVCLPIEESDVPGVEIYLECWAGIQCLQQSLRLEVWRPQNRLQLQLTPAQINLRPNQQTTLEIEVRDGQGQPLEGAEVVVWVVDEAVLDMAGHRIGNPWNHFARPQPAGTAKVQLTQYLRSYTLEQAWADYEAAQTGTVCYSPGYAGSGDLRQGPSLRSNFSPLASYQILTSDVQGRIHMAYGLPGSLTRYRVTAVASHGGEGFGWAESQVRTSLPLQLQPSPPRFWQQGDLARLPLLVQNLSPSTEIVEIATWNSDTLAALGPTAFRLHLPAGQRALLEMAFRAEQPGQARLAFLLRSNSGEKDAVVVCQPIYTPVSKESLACYGQLEQQAFRLPVLPPEKVHPEYGGLHIELSATLLHTLKDATLYLYEYPFECTEQLASRLLGLLAMKPMLQAWELPWGPQLDDYCQQLTDRLQERQQSDGAFSIWGAGPAHRFTTLFACLALGKASQDGYRVGESLSRARPQVILKFASSGAPSNVSDPFSMTSEWLDPFAPSRQKEPDSNWLDIPTHPKEQVLEAFANWVALELYAELAHPRILNSPPQALDSEALALCLPALAFQKSPQLPAFLQELAQRAEVNAATALLNSSPYAGSYETFYSPKRLQALALCGWIEAGGELDLAVKLARGLLDGRRQGRWSNTQENVFALLAMRRYYERYESTPPNFQARTWWSGRPLLQAQFDSYQQGRVAQKAPMDWLLSQGSGELTISKEGTGLLYYRVGLDYAPTNQQLLAQSRGFELTRTYLGQGVEQLGPQRWKAKLGSLVSVELSMQVPCERFHVALVCPRAAGLEPPGLASPAGPRDSFLRRVWYEHQQHRDDRSEAFCVVLPKGRHTWSFQVRATCAGEFRVPPARAEEMYHPECFGRTASEEFIIE